jgi:hypothetical protein
MIEGLFEGFLSRIFRVLFEALFQIGGYYTMKVLLWVLSFGRARVANWNEGVSLNKGGQYVMPAGLASFLGFGLLLFAAVLLAAMYLPRG